MTDGFGDRRGGGGGVAGGGTPVDGGYLRFCVGGARTVCAATSQTLYGFSSGLAGSDDAGFLSSHFKNSYLPNFLTMFLTMLFLVQL